MTTIERGRQFIRFQEYNDHEGETWNFYIPYDSEKEREAVTKLAEILSFSQEPEFDDEYFKFDFENLLWEYEVNTLIKYSSQGYMSQHNLIDGEFQETKYIRFMEDEDVGDTLPDYLYKGGIQKFFSSEPDLD